MLRYPRVAAATHTQNLGQRMLLAGRCTFAPTTTTSKLIPDPLPRETPHAALSALGR